MDPVPSDLGAMTGTNGVGPSVVFLYHFPINPAFAVMTGWWFGRCVTANFADWVVLCIRRLVVVCFAITPFLRMSSFTTPKLIMAGAKR